MPRSASRLQAEIQQRRPFRSARQEAAIGVLRTADRVRRVFARVVEPHGITGQQYNVLRILRGAGPGGLPTLAIAERMIERTPGITRLLDRLDAKGLVKRERCASDRRQVLCEIAPAGLALLVKLDGPVARAEDGALRRLTGADLRTLIRLLDAIRDQPS